MEGFSHCFLGKFVSHMTVPFHCVLDILRTSNNGKLFLDETIHVYQVTGMKNDFVLQEVQDVKKKKSVELQDVENEELDDEPKEKDATFANEGPPWTKGESLSQSKAPMRISRPKQ